MRKIKIIVRYWWEIMLKVLIVEASKSYKNKKPETEKSKIMYKYAQLKRFHHD